MVDIDPLEKSAYRLLTIPRWAWMVLIISLVVLFFFFLWFFFGKIPVTVEGRGIILTSQGLYNVQSKVYGTVVKQKINVGDVIEKGAFLMAIYDPQVELKYQESKSRFSLLQKQLKDLKEEISREAKDRKRALRVKMDSIKYSIALLQQEIDFGNRELVGRKKLLDEKLISPIKYNEGLLNLSQKKIELQNKIAEMAEVHADIKKEYRESEIEAKEQQLQAEKANLNVLTVSLEQGKIYSPEKGKILEILVNDGDQVKIGQSLVWMERESDNQNKPTKFVIYGYFQIDEGKKIRQDAKVRMELPNVNANLYGDITGVVKDVSLYAVSTEQLYSQIHNKELILFLTNEASAVIQVIIEPDVDPNHPDLFHWSSGLQPPIRVTPGTIGLIKATVEEISPIYYLIPLPIFKTLKGGK